MTQRPYGSTGREYRPVYSGSRRVRGLYEWTVADGTTRYGTRIRLDDGSQKRVTLDALTKTGAIAEFEALRTDKRRGEPVRDTTALRPTVAEVAADWLAALELLTNHRDPAKRYSPRTVALNRQRLHAHVLPIIGNRRIDEVTVANLRKLIDKLGTKLAPSTVTSAIGIVSSLMRYAVRQGHIARNPVRDLDRDDRPGTARQTEPRYLSADEVQRLLAEMTDTFRPVAAACAYAGLRISEALGLQWQDVDFDAKTITVRRQLDNDLTIREATKTPASTGTVPLLPALERELRAIRRRQAGIDLRRVQGTHLVFTTARDKPQSRRNVFRAVVKAADAAGLNGNGRPPLGLHDLRHSFVAMALDAGATLAETAVLARHANSAVTAKTYAGVSERAKAEVAAKLVRGGVGS
jgi:integrase